MQDRNVEFPNRYRMVKVPGTDDIFDLIPAPGEISNEGTFINKSTLLKDVTAGVFGMDASAVPDDVFAFVGKYNQHWWSVLHGEAGIGYEEKRTNISSSLQLTRTQTVSISYSNKINIDQKTGAVSLVNPLTVSLSYFRNFDSAKTQATSFASLAPAYVKGIADNPNAIYYMPAGTTYGNSSTIYLIGDYDTGWNIAFNVDATVKAQLVTSQVYNIPAGKITYAHSTDRNAYPDSGTVDGLTYQYLGIPFENAVTAPAIATGSYTGTGTYGASNPNRLTFDFAPKLVIVQTYGAGNDGYYLIMVNGSTYGGSKIMSEGYVQVSGWGTNTISWYHPSKVHSQFNASGANQVYIAFG